LGADGTARVWNVADGRNVQTLTPPRPPEALALAADGLTLATAGADGLRLWRTGDGRPLRFLEARSLRTVTFSSDGRLVAAASPGAVWIWRTEDGVLVRQIADAGFAPRLAFSPDGALLATWSSDEATDPLRLWRLSDGRLAGRPSLRLAVNGLAFAPDWSVLAVWSGETIQLFEGEAMLPGRRLAARAASRGALTVTADGSLLAFAVPSLARAWRLADGSIAREASGGAAETESLAFSADGRLLAVGLRDGAIQLWIAGPA
jgi:WD40 repeat protein